MFPNKGMMPTCHTAVSIFNYVECNESSLLSFVSFLLSVTVKFCSNKKLLKLVANEQMKLCCSVKIVVLLSF